MALRLDWVEPIFGMMSDEPELARLHGSQGLEQFLLLSKSARGLAAVQLIQDATSSPGTFLKFILMYIIIIIINIYKSHA